MGITGFIVKEITIIIFRSWKNKQKGRGENNLQHY